MFVTVYILILFFFVKQKTAYEMRISDWSSDVCSSDLFIARGERARYLAAAVALGFAVAEIDFGGCTGKDDALARFARALHFPDWFGGNWDALQDSLSDLSWLPAEGYLLLLEDVAQWREADGEGFDVALEIREPAKLGRASGRERVG